MSQCDGDLPKEFLCFIEGFLFVRREIREVKVVYLVAVIRTAVHRALCRKIPSGMNVSKIMKE